MAQRRVVIACFPGVELLDVSGPASVFSAASWLLGTAKGGYRVELVAAEPGAVGSGSGVALVAGHALSRVRGPIDTLLVPGGLESALEAGRALVPALASLARRARRVTSVCTGAFLLAEAGLLDGRRVVTHWAACAELARRFPTCQVEADRIYVQDGNVWTSAGVTAGMDLALALVEQDHGARLSLEVARWGVMYLRRPGGQSQFSAPLAAQASECGEVAELVTFIEAHLAHDLSVEALARRAHMSVRNFARVFRRETGKTPASYVELARLAAARRKLELSHASVKQIATQSGFGSVETMHRSFRRCLSVTPLQYRRQFQSR
jgi:transcriptional regulator GlxA family with amidase domain